MSFTNRILSGNAVVILITVAAIGAASPKDHLLMLAGIGLAMLAGSSLVLGFLCRRAFLPLSKVTMAIEKAAGGDLSVRVANEGFGEIARLGSSFNIMMNDMNKAMRQFFSVADLVRDSVGMVSANTSLMVSAAEDVAMQAGRRRDGGQYGATGPRTSVATALSCARQPQSNAQRRASFLFESSRAHEGRRRSRNRFAFCGVSPREGRVGRRAPLPRRLSRRLSPPSLASSARA